MLPRGRSRFSRNRRCRQGLIWGTSAMGSESGHRSGETDVSRSHRTALKLHHTAVEDRSRLIPRCRGALVQVENHTSEAPSALEIMDLQALNLIETRSQLYSVKYALATPKGVNIHKVGSA